MANVFLPNWTNSGAGAYLRAATKLEGITTTTKIRVEIDNFLWAESATAVQTIVSLGQRLEMFHDGATDSWSLVAGGTVTGLGTFEAVFGEGLKSASSDIALQLGADGTFTVEVDGLQTISRTSVRGTSNGVDDFIRFAARGTGDITTAARNYMIEGSQIGDIRIYLDDVLTIDAVMPSDTTLTQFQENVSSININVQNGDGTNFAALTATRRVTFNIPTEIQNLSTISTAVCTVDGTTGINFSSPVSVAQIDFSGATYEVNLDAVDTITNGQELVMLASDYVGGTATTELMMISTATAVVTEV